MAAVDHRAPAATVRALLDAGAAPVVTGRFPRTMDQVIGRHRRADLGFLQAAAR